MQATSKKTGTSFNSTLPQEAKVVLTIRVPPDIAQALALLRDDKSLNEFVLGLLRQTVERGRVKLAKIARRARDAGR